MGSNGYYATRIPEMLKDFDETANLARSFVISNYGVDFTDILHRDARQEYEAMIPEIPRIGGPIAVALNSFLLITAQEVALYKAMKKHGKTPAEAWEICHEALKLRMENYSRIKRWFMGRLMNSSFMLRRMKKMAERGEQVTVGDFQMKYVIGNGKDFTWGADYIKCGNYKLVKEQGVEEFAPYVCMSDIALGNALGWGLIRTGTLAEGCETCDFRFKKGGEVQISSKMPEVQATIERIARREAAGQY